MQFPYDLAICAILRNEGKFINEWIEWHVLMGVSKFYLYDNSSEDNTSAVLRPYVQKGIVDYIFFPGKYQQIPAYNDCLFRHRYDCEWIAFIDADEFLHPMGTESILEILRDMHSKHDTMGGLAVNWRLYGSNGHTSSQNGVIANYRTRAADECEDHATIKSIVNPRRTGCFLSAHYPIYYPGLHAVDECGLPVGSHLSRAGCSKLQRLSLAHYIMKSWEDWHERRSLGKADTFGEHDVSRSAFEAADANLNDVYDDSLVQLRTTLLNKQNDILFVPRPNIISHSLLEKQLNHVLEHYASLDVEELCAIYHAYSRPDPASGSSLHTDTCHSLIRSLLHLYISSQKNISIALFAFLDDELRRLPADSPGVQLLRKDLDRFRPLIQNWLHTSPLSNGFHLYINRLIESREPNYVPRVALVTPTLEDVPDVWGLLEVARIIHQLGMQLNLYAARGGVLQQSFADLNIPIILDAQMLHKTLSETPWYGAYDLIWLNTAECVPLLMNHSSPIHRPILWWVPEALTVLQQAPALAATLPQIDDAMLTALVSSPEVLTSFQNMRSNWRSIGILNWTPTGQNQAFTKNIAALADSLTRLGIQLRAPFEKGLK